MGTVGQRTEARGAPGESVAAQGKPVQPVASRPQARAPDMLRVMAPSPEQYLREHLARRGAANPERISNETWEWMVRTRLPACRPEMDMGLERDYSKGPRWCFSRYGISRTRMPDGRIICIGGEHEDFYDSDFFIYNDVIVLRLGEGHDWPTESQGEVEIYGYPTAAFGPTDSHAAVLIGELIYIIGGLGYQHERSHVMTPVYTLDTRDYRIERVTTSGHAPGLISKHHAAYDAATHSIVVREADTWFLGKCTAKHRRAFRLHLADMRWELIDASEPRRRYGIQLPDWDDQWWDRETVRPEVFRPKRIAHELLETSCSIPLEYGGREEWSLSVSGVRIRFEDQGTHFGVEVEGPLPQELISELLGEVVANLERVTGRTWLLHELADNATG